MMKKLLSLFCFLVCYAAAGFSQANSGQSIQPLWKLNPFDHKLFIENQGQFNQDLPNESNVLFQASFGDIKAYFTAKGLTYKYDKAESKEEDESNPEEQGKVPPKHTLYYLSAQWVGANPGVTVDAGDKLSYPYMYPDGRDKTITASVYRTVTYHNLYPGIDAVYEMPEKGGLKYSLIVHPGADISKVKLQYSGANKVSLNNKDVQLSTEAMGIFTDHAPVTYYQGNEQNTISSSYKLSGNEESFSINQGYDKTKTIVVDPWTNNITNFTTYKDAFDVDFDYSGNCYIYGSATPFQLIKLNNAGTMQWVFNSTAVGYGDIAVDRVSGEIYVTDGWIFPSANAAWKIKTNGTLMATLVETTLYDEFWRAVWLKGTRQVVIAGGGAADQVMMLDTNMATMAPINTLSSVNCCNDMPLLGADPTGTAVYGATGRSVVSATFNNNFYRLPVPALIPPVYTTADGYAFQELSTPFYYKGGIEKFGYNGIGISYNWAYMWNGDTLKRMNKATGAINTTLPVHKAKPYRWGGLYADSCDDIYIGVVDSVYGYNAALARTSMIYMGANTDTVYDVSANKTILYACGNGFAAAFTITVCSAVLPVQLTDFSCKDNAYGITLNWTTASETNNKYFTIERSGDGINFTVIAKINGAGNSTGPSYYQYIDNEPLPGNNYYRLSQTNNDGSTTYIGTTECNMSNYNLEVYPNPSTGSFSVMLPSGISGEAVSVTVTDLLGQIVYSSTILNIQKFTVDMSVQPSSIYILKVTGANGTYTHKLMVCH
jgi:hypothetical protein